MTEVKPASHVYTAINQIAAAFSKDGISKDRTNVEQKFKFRGIDDVMNALASLLVEHKLVIFPRATERSVSERLTRSGSKMFNVVLKVDFDFISIVDGSTHTVTMYGEAQDSGDKATNKAQSAAYKYAVLQTFCIPTEGDNDADATTPPETAAAPAPTAAPSPEPSEIFSSPEEHAAWPAATAEKRQEMYKTALQRRVDWMKKAVEHLKVFAISEDVVRWKSSNVRIMNALSDAQRTAMNEKIAERVRQLSQAPLTTAAAPSSEWGPDELPGDFSRPAGS